MIEILESVEVYSPLPLGKKNILISNGRIEDIFVGKKYSGITTRNMEGLYCVPGFIDGHVHLIGGGGEGGFASRVEEISAEKLLKCGITGVIGLLGTDSVTRSLETLFAKTMALREKGLDAYMVTGSYSYPIKTITDSVEKDIVFIELIVGVGELAISDRRGSEIGVKEIKKTARDVYRASLLSGKKGKIILHVGNTLDRLSLLFRATAEEEVEVGIFIPTHVNRNWELLKDALEWIRKGGYVDLTACLNGSESVSVAQALEFFEKNGADLSHVTVSSDAQGSLPIFDKYGNFLSMGVSDCSTLFDSFKACVNAGRSIENALMPFTANVADFFGFNSGKIERGKKANLLFLNPEDLSVEKVMAEGRFA